MLRYASVCRLLWEDRRLWKNSHRPDRRRYVPQAILPALTEEETGTSMCIWRRQILTCVLPKGFQDDGDNEGLYVHKSYPTDISTISHVISEEGDDISQWSADDFKAAHWNHGIITTLMEIVFSTLRPVAGSDKLYRHRPGRRRLPHH